MSEEPLTHCSACGSQLTEGAVFCAQCGFPIGPIEAEAEAEAAALEVPAETQKLNLSFQEKPPPIRPPSPTRQFTLGASITLAIITFLPLDRLFEVEREPANTKPPPVMVPSSSPPREQKTSQQRTRPAPINRTKPPGNERKAKALKLPQDIKIPTPEEAFKHLGKEADAPEPEKAAVPGGGATKPPPKTKRQQPAPTRLGLRRGVERLLGSAKRMETMVASGRTDDCDTLRSRSVVWVRGLRYNAARYETVGFLSSAINLLDSCVACDETAAQSCGEVKRLLELEARTYEEAGSP